MQEYLEKSPLARKESFPTSISPMLAGEATQPFNRKGWVFETKWDGYRMLSFVNQGKVVLYSRQQKPLALPLPDIHNHLASLGHTVVLDGELVAVNPDGMPVFQALHTRRIAKGFSPVYYVFDVLHFDGYSLRELPLTIRKTILSNILGASDSVRYTTHVAEKGIDFFEKMKALGHEGIVAKNSTSTYQEGKRSSDWVKIKAYKRRGWGDQKTTS